MSHPYRAAAHKNDPKWLDGLKGYQNDSGPVNDGPERTKDTAATVRNYNADPKATAQAAYSKK